MFKRVSFFTLGLAVTLFTASISVSAEDIASTEISEDIGTDPGDVTDDATIEISSAADDSTLEIVGETGDNVTADDNTVTETALPEEIEVGEVSCLHTTAVSSSKVELKWKAAENATGYIVYGKTSGGDYKLLKRLKKCTVRLNVKKGKDYKFKVVPVCESGEALFNGECATISFDGGEIVSLSKKNYSYKQCTKDIKALKKKYHDYVKYETIGDSVEGRNIYDIILGNEDADLAVLVVCELHAREYVTSLNAMKQIEYYLSKYNSKIGGKKVSKVLSNCCIHYVVMANPDGAMMVQKGKTHWKANKRGVDLNRNFKYRFVSRGNRWNGTFTGKKAESEPESRAVGKLTRRLNDEYDVRVVNFHSTGSIIFGNCDKRLSCYGDTRKMYNICRKETKYRYLYGYPGTASGNFREYCIYNLDIPCITLEVGTTMAPNSLWEYPTIFNRTKNVVIKVAGM